MFEGEIPTFRYSESIIKPNLRLICADQTSIFLNAHGTAFHFGSSQVQSLMQTESLMSLIPNLGLGQKVGVTPKKLDCYYFKMTRDDQRYAVPATPWYREYQK